MISKERFEFLPLIKSICSSFAAFAGDLSSRRHTAEISLGDSANFSTDENPVHVFVRFDKSDIGDIIFNASAADDFERDLSASVMADSRFFWSGFAREWVFFAILIRERVPSAGGNKVVAAPAVDSRSMKGSVCSFIKSSFAMSRRSPYKIISETTAPPRDSRLTTSPVINPRPTENNRPVAEFFFSSSFKYLFRNILHAAASGSPFDMEYSRHAKASAS